MNENIKLTIKKKHVLSQAPKIRKWANKKIQKEGLPSFKKLLHNMKVVHYNTKIPITQSSRFHKKAVIESFLYHNGFIKKPSVSKIKNKKEVAKNTEDIRVAFICKCINNPTTEYEKKLGNELRESYTCKFDKIIEKVEKTGRLKDHFDFVIHHTDGTIHRCEEKGCELGKHITKDSKPWENSVQVLNGIGNSFTLGCEYAKIFYNKILKERSLDKFVDVELPELPSEAEWLKKDAFRCGDPITNYGKKLKEEFRKKYGDKTSFTGQKGTPDFIRPIMNKEMEKMWAKDDTCKKQLIKELQEKLDDIFEQKDCYLQTSGDITIENIDFMWKPRISPPKITDITIDIQKDIYFDIHADTGKSYSFRSILRWGKGCGFSNIRFDVR
jgi:hypothetical protein